MKKIIDRKIGKITDNRELTDDKAAPATLTALVNIKNENTNMNARIAPKTNVSQESDISFEKNKNSALIRAATK